MSKVIYRIPHPLVAYGYIEVEKEYEDGPSVEAIRASYDELTKAFQDGEGIGAKAFAEVVLEYCSTGHIEGAGEWYEGASSGQKAFLNELKKIIRSKN